MNDPNASDDLPFLDDLPYTPGPEEQPEQQAAPPPAAAGVAAATEQAKQAVPPEPAVPAAPVRSPDQRAVIPPAVLAQRMQRYSIYLIVLAFLLVGVNYDALTLSAVLWFAAGLTAGFAILCAVAVVLLNAIAWNFDRLRDELRGGREVVDLRK